MERIRLKSSTNRFHHDLIPLIPLDPNSNTKAYRFETEYPPEIIRSEKTGMFIGINFRCGPNLVVGMADEQTKMVLKEICPTFDKATGEYKYLSLIFE